MTNATATTISTVTPELIAIDGQITTTSTQVAEHFGKRHADVLRAIGKLECSAEFTERNFALMVNEVQIGSGATRKDPAYRITKDGFMFLAMGFTGKEAAQWKEAYITAFNKMEAKLSSATGQAPITPAQKQYLHELVDLIAATGRQPHAETWARLHRKFSVNKYELLRQDQFDAACTYLRSKMADADIGALVQKHFPQALRLSAPQPSIDPVELLTTGQADPLHALSSTQRAAIARRAFELANEAYGLIHTHIERRVAYKSVAGTADLDIAPIVNATTLGNALTHRYTAQFDTMDLTLRWLQDTVHQTLKTLQQDIHKFSTP
jgi:Rha family phage regulatory protein